MSNYPYGTAQRLCEIALAEVGYIEQPVNVTKYGKDSGAMVCLGAALSLCGARQRLA